MKKLFTLSVVFLGLTFAAQAQDASKATISDSAKEAKAVESATSKEAVKAQEVILSEKDKAEYERIKAERKAKMEAAQSKSGDANMSIKAASSAAKD